MMINQMATICADVLPMISEEKKAKQESTQFKPGNKANPEGKNQRTAETNPSPPSTRDIKKKDEQSTIGQIAKLAGVSHHKARQFCEYRLPYGMGLEWSVLLKISEKTKYREIILAQEVIDEPLAKNGEIGNGRNESSFRITKPTKAQDTASYILRRLARDGQNEPDKAELFKQVTKGEISHLSQKSHNWRK